MSQRLSHAAFLVCITFLVWGTSLWNGFVWDDRILIQKNEATLSRLSLTTIFLNDFWSTETEAGTSNYYRPLVTLSYMLDYKLFGLNPMGFHATNLLLHAAGVLGLWYLLSLLGISMGVATFAASVWAIHPAVAESVAWVSGRTDSLATVFMLFSIAAAVRAYSNKRFDPRALYLSAALFGAGLLSKESAFVTPLLIAIFLAMLGKRHKIERSAIGLFGGVGLAWFLLRWSVLEKPIGAETGEGASLSIGVLSLLHVWGNLVWPPIFRIEYGSSLTSQALLGGAMLGAALITWILFVLAAKHGPRPTRYLYLAGLIAFVPSVMAVLMKSMIGSRLIYTASAFVISGFAVGLRPEARSKVWRLGLTGVLGILVIVTISRATLWRSDARLFSTALEATDASSRNHLNLGIALYDSGDFTGAINHLSRDMERAALDQKFYMLSLLYTSLGCESLAEENLKRAIEVNPLYYSAAHNLAGLYATQGRLEESREVLLKVAERDARVRPRAMAQIEVLERLSVPARREPSNAAWCSDESARRELFASAVGLNRLAGERLRTGQTELAEALIQGALRVDPWFVPARLNLAQYYALQGNKAAARAVLESILNTNPGEERARRLLASLDAPGPPR